MLGMKCQGVFRNGSPCRFQAKDPDGYCRFHCRSLDCECSVCLTAVRSKASLKTLSKCGHGFHKRCIRSWLARGLLTCPICRAPCVAEISQIRCRLHKKIQTLLRTLPPPSGSYFPAYVIGLLSCPNVQQALQMDDDTLQTLIDVAYQTGSSDAFFKSIQSLTFPETP